MINSKDVESEKGLRKRSVEVRGALVKWKVKAARPGTKLKGPEEFSLTSSSSQNLEEPKTGRRVTDVRALSDIEVTPLGCQRANGVLNFWRESL